MSKPSPRTFDNSLKWLTFFLTLNWVCDRIPAVLTKGLTFQCGARSRVPSTKIKIYQNFVSKKSRLRCISACRKHLKFFWGAFLTNTIWILILKNCFNVYSPENVNASGEFRRSREAMHAGKIDPAPRCGGLIFMSVRLKMAENMFLTVCTRLYTIVGIIVFSSKSLYQ